MNIWDVLRIHIPSLPAVPRPDENITKCPFHKGGQERHPSFSINGTTLKSNCFTCGEGWGLRGLLLRLGVDPQGYEISEEAQASHVPEVPDVILPEALLGIFRRCPTYMLDCGFDKALLQYYEIGYDEALDRVTFPIRDMEGQLRAISGRLPDGEPRYKVYKQELTEYWQELPSGYEPQNHSYLWNGHRCRAMQRAEELPFVVVTEGFKAALWVAQAGYPNVVATMGCQVTKGQTSLLRGLDCPVLWFFDNNEAGCKGQERAKRLYGVLSWCADVRYPREGQPDDLTIEEVDEAIVSALVVFQHQEGIIRGRNATTALQETTA